MLGLIIGAGILGFIIAVMEGGEFPGWGKMILLRSGREHPGVSYQPGAAAGFVHRRFGGRSLLCRLRHLGHLRHERQARLYRGEHLAGDPIRHLIGVLRPDKVRGFYIDLFSGRR